MTRGNQREKAREKSQKKLADHAKGAKETGTKLEERKHRDAEIMRAKQEKKLAEKEAAGASGGAAAGGVAKK